MSTRSSGASFAVDHEMSVRKSTAGKSRRCSVSERRKSSVFDSLSDKGTIGKEKFDELFDVLKAETELELEREDVLQKKAAKNKRRAIVLGLIVGFLLVFLSVSIAANFAVVFSVVDDQVKTTTSSDGTMRSKDGHAIVKTDKVRSYTTLGSLPRQSIEYLRTVREIVLVVDTAVRKYTIENFKWDNCSSMVLYTTKMTHSDTHAFTGNVHEIVIQAGRAYVDFGDGSFGRVAFSGQVRRSLSDTPANPRRLSDLLHPMAAQPDAHLLEPAQLYSSWDEVQEAYRSGQHARGLESESGGDALLDLYRFFGGIVEADAVDDVGEQCAAAVSEAQLKSADPAPLPDVPLRSKWTVAKGEPAADAINGTWYMDLTSLDTPRFHLVSKLNGSFTHEVVSQSTSSKFTYHSWDPSYATADMDAETVTAAAAAKQQCTEDPSFGGVDTGDKATELFQYHKDGSATWLVGGWMVTVAPSGTVTQINDIDVKSVVEYEASEKAVGVMDLYTACTPDEEPIKEALETIGRRRMLEEGGSNRRGLGAWNSFQAWASGTQWCASGSDLANTPCPLTQSDNGDMACHRHDHGKKANGIIGGMAVRLGCDIDRGLAERTSNGAAQAVFGSWGLAQTWGCYDHGSYSCWNWKSKWWGGYWRYGGYCNGEHTHYGPWRYSSYSHSYGWKAQSRCTNSLPWGTGQI